MSVNPQRLLILRAIRRTGGVLAAAEALHLTPSGISQHLARLEAETGLALVDRSRRGGGRSVRLTAAGQRMADHADLLAETLAVAERDAESMRGRDSGPVRIGGFASVLDRLVAPVVGRVAVSHPAIEPRVVEVDEEAGLADVAAGHLDLLLGDRTGEARPRDTAAVRVEDLRRDPFRIVVPIGWPTSPGATELLRGPWVTTPPGYATNRLLVDMCAAAGVEPDCRHVCTESSTMLALVGAGLGAAIVPELSLRYLPRAGVRTTAGVLDPGHRVLTVSYRHGRGEPTPAIAVILDGLRAQSAET